MKVISATFGAFMVLVSATLANGLNEHFLYADCRTHSHPTLIVTDVTATGEIDDSISLMMYRELERRQCVQIIGVVSIFGNGGSTSRNVHKTLPERLHLIGIDDWDHLLLRGPDRNSFSNVTSSDFGRLSEIAGVISGHKNVVIVELGPMTTSAQLFRHGLIRGNNVEQILGIGGRSQGERFTTGRKIGCVFEFRDMNVAEDTNALAYLLDQQASKLWMVTYRTGVERRELSPIVIGSGAPMLADHAERRANLMMWLGYESIPSWDTWTTSYFLKGGSYALGCKPTRAAMRHVDRGFRDHMQLWLGLPAGVGRTITACHEVDE